MSPDPKAQAALALHRFGVGPRAGSIAAIASDPRGALIAELDRPGAGRIANTDLLASGEAARAAFEFQRVQRLARQAERAARDSGKPQSSQQADAAQQAPSQQASGPDMKPAGQPATPPPRPGP